MSASFDIKEWWWITPITAIESKNQVVIGGQRTESDPQYLYTFQNNPDGQLVETRMDTPCQHHAFSSFYNLITVVQNGKELLALYCRLCKDVKLVDMETKQVTPVFKFPPTDTPCGICLGPDGDLFVASLEGHIQQFDSSFRVTNTFDLSSFVSGLGYCFPPICYLPAPHNTLVVYNLFELRAVSLRDGHQVWSQPSIGFKHYCLLYSPQQDVLLISVLLKPQVRVLNPSDGVILQTIEIPNIHSIYTMCLCNDQIIMVQQSEKDITRRCLSYYSLKRNV